MAVSQLYAWPVGYAVNQRASPRQCTAIHDPSRRSVAGMVLFRRRADSGLLASKLSEFTVETLGNLQRDVRRVRFSRQLCTC